MARFAIIDTGRVTNIIEADAGFAATLGAIDATGAGIGDLWDGETFTAPPAPPAPIPQSVTMRQASIALELAGLLDDVEAIVATLPRIYQIEWQRASNVLRDNLLVEMVRQQQGMTDAQIDALFIAAAAL
jgi:hypothetical protein